MRAPGPASFELQRVFARIDAKFGFRKINDTLADFQRVLMGSHPELPVRTAYEWRRFDRLDMHDGDRKGERSKCDHCGRLRWGVWFLAVKSSGTRVAVLRCIVCTWKMREIGATKVGGDLPLWVDNAASAPPCEHCGSRCGTEVHHWAPRHLFDDADNWPTSSLCRECHRLWHNIVTPQMAQKRSA